MLKQVLHEIETANGPIHLDQLSRKLGIEQGALKGMIEFWVRKGKLKDGAPDGLEDAAMCGGGCHGSCSGTDNCSFVIHMPRTYSLNPPT